MVEIEPNLINACKELNEKFNCGLESGFRSQIKYKRTRKNKTSLEYIVKRNPQICYFIYKQKMSHYVPFNYKGFKIIVEHI